jgi:hypothetical protein
MPTVYLCHRLRALYDWIIILRMVNYLRTASRTSAIGKKIRNTASTGEVHEPNATRIDVVILDAIHQ